MPKVTLPSQGSRSFLVTLGALFLLAGVQSASAGLSSVRPSPAGPAIALPPLPSSGSLPAGTGAPAARVAGNDVPVGTVVVEGGRSFALFADAQGTWRVGEGDRMVDGSRLLEVHADRVVVERQGRTEELLLFGQGRTPTGGSARSVQGSGAGEPATAARSLHEPRAGELPGRAAFQHRSRARGGEDDS